MINKELTSSLTRFKAFFKSGLMYLPIPVLWVFCFGSVEDGPIPLLNWGTK